MKVIATYNIKGGVGKTATAVNIAYLAASEGYRVLLWDLDPQAAASFLFRVRPKVKGGGKALIAGKRPVDDAIKATDFENLDLLPADFTYRHLDLHAADLLLVPLIPTTLSVRTLDQLTGFIDGFDGRRPEILAFFSMMDRRKRLHLRIAAELPAERKDVATAYIPALSAIERMSEQRTPVTAAAPRSQASRHYLELWQEARARAG